MFILCASGSFAIGHNAIGENIYLPAGSERLEVQDLWYERRRGATPHEQRIQQAFHPGIHLPRGKFSALCHASFQRESCFVTQSLPVDGVRTDALFGYDDSVRTFRYMSKVVPYYASTSVSGWDYLYLGDGATALVSYNVNCRYYPGSFVAYSVTGYIRYVRSYYRYNNEYWVNTGEKQFATGWVTAGPDEWTFSAIHREAESAWLSAARSAPISEWDGNRLYADILYPSTKTPADYANLASMALDSALRFKDKELVDYSVGDAVQPYAFQDIDFIVGRAAAYANGLEDIQTESDNQLQNIAALVTGLEAFAFGESNTFEQWLRQTNRKLDADLVKQLSRKNWYRTDSKGRSRLRRLADEFRRKKGYLLTQSGLDRIQQVKEDAFGDTSSAWLRGRYEFSTSVADLGQEWDYWYDRALRYIGKRSADHKCHGKADLEKGFFQASFVMREKALRGLTKCFESCYMHGLEPNAYVLWDFVPFSFVVDWFFPVGDTLAGYVRSTHFTPELWEYIPKYDGSAMCYSLSYTSQSPIFGVIDVYTRWYEPGPPEVDPSLLWHGASSKSKRAVQVSLGKYSLGTIDVGSDSRLDRDAKRSVDVLALL